MSLKFAKLSFHIYLQSAITMYCPYVLDSAGLTTLSLRMERSHHAGRKLNISGSVVAALEPFVLSYSGDEMTLWDRQDESVLQMTTEGHHVLGVVTAVEDIHAGGVTLVIHIIMWEEINCLQMMR